MQPLNVNALFNSWFFHVILEMYRTLFVFIYNVVFAFSQHLQVTAMSVVLSLVVLLYAVYDI